jgi:hypothetical protein
MKILRIPVPEVLAASYLVPLPAAMTEAQARRRIVKAVATRLNGPMQVLILDSIRRGEVITDVVTAADTGQPLQDQPGDGDRDDDAGRLAQISGAPAYVVVSAASPASLIAVHEWKARGPAAALAASIGAPVIDAVDRTCLDAGQALASLPEASFTEGPGHDIAFGFSLQPWVRFRGVTDQGLYWAVSDGMWRVGLPEFAMGGCERDLREELKEILSGLIFRIWSGLLRQAHATPNAEGLMKTPRSIRIPAELTLGREDLDRARGVPNRGGASTTIALRLHSPQQGRPWLTVCPPREWDMGTDQFIGDVCHAMFGFEKPAWYYRPQLGALVDALKSVPEVRHRFNDGKLPPGGQLLVRHRTSHEDEFRWAQVESWAEEDVALVHDVGPELSPIVKPGRAMPLEAKLIFDWAIWADGEGAVEGARTEGVGCGF